MSIKGIFVIIIYLICLITVIWWIFYYKFQYAEAAVAIVLFVFGAVGAFLFKPIRDDLDYFANNLFIKKSIYRICIFGRPGSGKSTFIETAFTLIEPERNRKSTDAFDYYHFKVQLGLKKFRNVGIADYKGQNPSQVIIKSSPDFFGAESSRVINAILFVVDLVPRKSDEQGNPLNDESLLKWLRDGNTLEKIKARVQEQYEYINEASLELLFASLHSKSLKSVMFSINKLDLIDKLIDDGYLDISNFRNSREYAEHYFERMSREIARACSQLDIKDFSTFTVCAKKTDTLKPIISHLLRGGN
jgi:energy-coupling factor transporter ATP-binding protein EcfA2